MPPKASFDAQMTVTDFVVEGRSHFDNTIVLYMQSQRAANSTVRADGIRLRLFVLIPGFRLTHLMLTAKHEGAGWTHADTVPQ